MNKPIRILQVLATLNIGGAETLVMNIYRNIDRSKIQFDFMIHTNEKCDYEDEVLALGGRIYRVSRYKGKNHFIYKKEWNNFFKNHKEHKIIHGHIRSIAAIYLKIAKKYGRITIAHSHSTASRGNSLEQIAKNIMQLPIRYIGDYFFACSNEAGKWLFGKKILNNKNYKLIKNGIEVEKYIFNEKKRKKIRKALKLNGKFVIGHVGTFTYPKNHKFLIEIFNEVYKINPNSILLIVGEGSLEKQIKEQIKKLKLESKVIFAGSVLNVGDYLQGMDSFLFPSIFEGMPMSLIEAQASGLNCIVSDSITKESKILNSVKYISLKESSKYWARKILETSYENGRRNTSKEITNNGYNIKSIVKDLEDVYYLMQRR
ncbi:MAG: glycosyltransferase family 1 protein [Fusobacterium sp. JB019]|nr:glycosyltransferase family 1 protein [Fusobacterium sp. JB019]